MTYIGGSLYRHTNSEMYWMAVEHFRIEHRKIDRINRRERKVEMIDGSTLDMPPEWDVGTYAQPSTGEPS